MRSLRDIYLLGTPAVQIVPAVRTITISFFAIMRKSGLLHFKANTALEKSGTKLNKITLTEDESKDLYLKMIAV
jgi:hypothetical protein